MENKLKEQLKNAYAPYSNYQVSAAVVMKDGNVFYGVNVENASYGATICAERVAITSAIAAGYKKGDFKELHVLSSSNKFAFPCFICRQVISEFFEKTNEVTLYQENDKKTFIVEELTPYPFSKEDLEC